MENPYKNTRMLLTEKEMADSLAISWRGLSEFRKRRMIPVVRLGRAIRYNPSEVVRALEKLTVRSI